MVNFFAVVATVLALGASVVSVLEITLRTFVEVTIPVDVTDPQDPEVSCVIAGLGVYVTEYDSSCLDQATLEASHVPVEAFSSPTTEFKLLFPAQENLVAEVLPVNDEVLAGLDSAFGEGVASGAIQPILDNINAVEFKSCEQYMDDIQPAMQALFTPLNDQFLPLVIPLITAEIGVGITTLMSGLGGSFGVPPAQNNSLTLLMGSTFDLVAPALPLFGPACADVTLATPITAQSRGCVAGAYGAALANPNIPFGAVPHVRDMLEGIQGIFAVACAPLDDSTFPLATCYGIVSTEVVDAGAFNTLVLVGGAFGPASPTFCSFFDDCPAQIPKVGFFNLLVTLFGEVKQLLLLSLPAGEERDEIIAGLDEGVKGLSAYLGLTNILQPAIVTLENQTDVEIVALTTTPQPFPDTFPGFFYACGMLQFANIVEPLGATTLPAIGAQCGFLEFFITSIELAKIDENPLAEILEALLQLYGACSQTLFTSPRDCDLFFPSLFMSGAYSFDLDEGFLTLTPENNEVVFDLAQIECEDDAVDKEKISEAQVLMGFAVALYILSFLTGVLSLIVKNSVPVVLTLAGFLSIGGFALNLGGLLTVRSAPVYDTVGLDAVLFRPRYTEGSVILLALIAFILSLLGAALFFAGGCYELRMARAAAEEDGEMVDEKKEVKDEVVALEAAETK